MRNGQEVGGDHRVARSRRPTVAQLDALAGKRNADAQRFVLGGTKHRVAGKPPRLPHFARRVGEGLLNELVQHVGEPTGSPCRP